MAKVYNYMFDNLTHLNDDACDLSQRNVQNTHYGNYSTTNYFAKNCGMKKTIEFATSQPNVFYNGGFGNSGAGGCNINDDSNVRIGSIQTHPKCRVSLFQRPFATVPYLGRGPCRPVVESRLQQGDFITNKKSCNTVTETEFKQHYTPLVPSLAATIQNPNNLVEGAAAEGWIRGGLPTRDLIRDQDYFQRHGKNTKQ